jgi:hypothetical protein
VLEPIRGFRPSATVPDRFDVIRAYLRMLGPASPANVASYLDARQRDVRERWPADAVEVTVDGEARWVLADDAERLAEGPAPTLTRLLGPFDPFLQARDRALLVPDAGRHKELWPTLGRPGAVLVDGAVVGSWRARKVGGKLAVGVALWGEPTAAVRAAVGAEAERLAAFRRLPLAAVDSSP